MMELQMEKRFHNLTLEQVQALDKVLTEVIPIHGRGNFPTLEVRAKDIIRVVKDRLVERDIQVKDIRLNGSTASHVMVRDNGLGYRDLDIIFGVELPRQEDFQVIKEVVLGSLRDLLPCGVNRRKITCLMMKEAYVQKMVKVCNEQDRWSLISLSNNKAQTVGLRFVSSLRRQFEFSVDSFQIILDRMLESYWETETKQGRKLTLPDENLSNLDVRKEKVEGQPSANSRDAGVEDKKDSPTVSSSESPSPSEEVTVSEENLMDPAAEDLTGKHEARQGSEAEGAGRPLAHLRDEEGVDDKEDLHPEKDVEFELCGGSMELKGQLTETDCSLESPPEALFTEVMDPLGTNVCPGVQDAKEELSESKVVKPPSDVYTEKSAPQEVFQCEEMTQSEAGLLIDRADETPTQPDSHLQFSFPPPAKKTCSMSQAIVPDYYPSPKLQRKMSRKVITKSPPPEKWSLLTDVSDLTTQLFQPIEIPNTIQPNPPLLENMGSMSKFSKDTATHMTPGDPPGLAFQDRSSSEEAVQPAVKPKHSKKSPDPKPRSHPFTAKITVQQSLADQNSGPAETDPERAGPGSWAGEGGKATITVEAECMFGDFEQAMDHLRCHLIATHSPEEIRGGGLLKYSDLLVRDFKAASETEIKSLERYMCSRFFIDFPDVSEQQRVIQDYLQCHFVGNEETSKYDYLMTLRRVIDESTVCLMGHERRQTLNMITVLALRVLGEQNAIPNTSNITCFYQPAPYMSEPIFSSYYIAQAQPPLVYHPYPLHVHMQTGLV